MSRSRKVLISTSFSVALLASTAIASAQAATATGTILVSATVLSFCTIVTLPLAFGNYASAALAATTNIVVACTLGTTYNVGLDVGTGGAGATVAARQMTFGTNKLGYQLTRDLAGSLPWGPTIGTNTATGTATGLAQTLVIYGAIAAGQLVGPGAYTDLVTATVTY